MTATFYDDLSSEYDLRADSGFDKEFTIENFDLKGDGVPVTNLLINFKIFQDNTMASELFSLSSANIGEVTVDDNSASFLIPSTFNVLGAGPFYYVTELVDEARDLGMRILRGAYTIV